MIHILLCDPYKRVQSTNKKREKYKLYDKWLKSYRKTYPLKSIDKFFFQNKPLFIVPINFWVEHNEQYRDEVTTVWKNIKNHKKMLTN